MKMNRVGAVLACAGVCLLGVSASVFAEAEGLGQIAKNITGSFQSIGELMIGTAYLAGIGFGIAAIFKFKQHKDNPTQIPVGTPIALLVIAIALVFLPFLFKPAGETIFGNAASSFGSSGSGFEGGGAGFLPGESGGGS